VTIHSSVVGIPPYGGRSFKQDLNWGEHRHVFKKWATEMLPRTYFCHPLFSIYITKDVIIVCATENNRCSEEDGPVLSYMEEDLIHESGASLLKFKFILADGNTYPNSGDRVSAGAFDAAESPKGSVEEIKLDSSL
jgi:hypothetical protein